jgi:hypothetical protein
MMITPATKIFLLKVGDNLARARVNTPSSDLDY